MKHKYGKDKWILLFTWLLISLITIESSILMKKEVKKECYDEAVAAADNMAICMQVIKDHKNALGIELSEEDFFQTGLIGEEYNFITTTKGDPAAKRTTCNPEMAALVVVMLEDAGFKEGDILGCSFSGSFPALNIAVLSACDAMGIKAVYMCSCGASTFGANNPELTFPEMAMLLYDKGLIRNKPVLITKGGSGDMGHVADPEEFEEIWNRVSRLNLSVYEEPDFYSNVMYKKQLLDNNEIDGFLAVGGNVTALGLNMVTDSIGQGIIRSNIADVNDKSGLIELYLYEKKPVILLLNIKQLVAEYGIEFDPAFTSEIGTGSFYYEVHYPVWILILGIVLEAGVFLLLKNKRVKSRIG